jgi:DNA-binding transcriptional ArsR family regulator
MMSSEDALSQTFAALSDPTRRKILARLADGELSVTALAEPFQMTQPAISKHLKVLERAGLVVRGRKAQWRPAKLQAAPLKEAADWVEQYRQHWEERFDRLDSYLRTMEEDEHEKEPVPETKPKGLSRIRSAMIDRIWPNRKGE